MPIEAVSVFHANCPHCEGQLETERHVFVHCPKTADLRKRTADERESVVSGSLGYRKANVARLEWLVDHVFKDSSRLWPDEECEYYLGKLLKFEDLIEGDEDQKQRAVDPPGAELGGWSASDWQDGSTNR